MCQLGSRFLAAACMLAVLSMATVGNGTIIGENRLEIDFTDAQQAHAKASWSPADKLSITKDGLGWDGSAASSYDGWIQTKPMAIGVSWRPASAVSVRVAIHPPPRAITLNDG